WSYRTWPKPSSFAGATRRSPSAMTSAPRSSAARWRSISVSSTRAKWRSDSWRLAPLSWRGWMVFLALCVVWGIPYFFVKLALEDFSPDCVAWSRAALGAAVMLPLAWKRGVLRPAMANKGAILAFAVCEMVIPLYLIALGEQWVSSSLAGILVATLPIIVALLSRFFGLKERLGIRRLTGLPVAFPGVIALLGLDRVAGPRQLGGVACIFVATLGYAVGPLIVERQLRGVDELGAVAVTLAAAAVILLPTAALSAPTHLPSVLALSSLVVL